MPDVTGVSHIELTVRDADRSASWYEQVLGMQRLTLPEEYRNDSVPAREVNMRHPTAGLVLSLIQHESGEDGDFSELRAGLDHSRWRSTLAARLRNGSRTSMVMACRTRRSVIDRTDRCWCFVTLTTFSLS
jgi:catechol 2,3-dioxygenase-like lactoylglutathione lyase family enzyme